MCTQFVWFMGHSAVGKNWIIKKCVEDQPWAHETFALDVTQGVIDVRDVALDARGEQWDIMRYSQYEKDKWKYEPGFEKTWLDDVLKLPLRGCVLLKWQYRSDNAIDCLRKARPNASHIAILLRRELEKHREDYFNKRYVVQYPGKSRAASDHLFKIEEEKNVSLARKHCGKVDLYMEFNIEGEDFTPTHKIKVDDPDQQCPC